MSQTLPGPQVPQTHPFESLPHCLPPQLVYWQTRQTPLEHTLPVAHSGPQVTWWQTGSSPQTCPAQSGQQGGEKRSQVGAHVYLTENDGQSAAGQKLDGVRLKVPRVAVVSGRRASS
jgi:hypothetical protein